MRHGGNATLGSSPPQDHDHDDHDTNPHTARLSHTDPPTRDREKKRGDLPGRRRCAILYFTMAPRSPDALNGVVIGLLSSLGSALLIGTIFVLIYFFKYTNSGRILLDRIGRPGEYDDEQAFAREEAEALETMDDMQRIEYLRAKGTSLHRGPAEITMMTEGDDGDIVDHANFLVFLLLQHSSPPTRPSPCRPTSRCPSTWPYKRRASRHGSSSPNLRSPTASLRAAPR